MKVFILLMTIGLMHVYASGKAQITLKKDHASLKAIFKEISRQSGVDFFIDSKTLENTRSVSLDLKDVSLEEALKTSIDGQGLDYSIQDKIVVIKPKEKNFLERISDYFAAIDVYGKIVDENGSPLGGATVTVKSTKKGVNTKADGNFSMANIEEGTTLVITFMGYSPKEIKAAKQLGTIRLEPSTSKLDEVQIQAYGQTTQRTTVSNITSIKAEDIAKQNVTNPLLAIQGRVAGLTISPSNGLPNSGVSVRLYGQNSFLAGQDPLYIIDGIPYSSQLVNVNADVTLGFSGSTTFSQGGAGNTMSFLNPDDIESIDVLKDASATAIYGSRAANGAIIITTKKGKIGKMKVDFSIENGRSIIAKNIDVLNTEEYVTMRNEAFRNDNILPNADNAFDILNLNGWSTLRNTNWQDELISKHAQFTSTSLGVSGGTETTNYRFSGTYRKQGAAVPGNYADQKGSLHFNIGSSSTNQKFKIQFTGSYMYDENLLPKGSNDLASVAIFLSPTAPTLYNTDGTLNWGTNDSGFSTWSNPLAGLQNIFRNKTSNLLASTDLSYQILDNLRLSLHSGFNNLSSKEFAATYGTSLAPETDLTYERASFFATTSQSNWIIEPQINYSSKIGPGKFNLLVGGTINQSSQSGVGEVRSGYSSDNLLENRTLAPFGLTTQDVNTQYKYAAIFSRLGYNVSDKYLFELTGRRDGSSRFGPENRYHTFAAVGLGWVFSEEKVIKNNFSFISFGKLRFSFGTTGNDQIKDYSYLDLVSTLGVNLPYQQVIAFIPSDLYNPVLQWEETKKTNYGLDLGLLKDRITLSLDYASNTSSNSLQYLILPHSTGANSVIYNFDAKTLNTSWQFNLTSNNIINGSFRWKTSLVFSRDRNKLLSQPETLDIRGYKTGEPLDYDLSRYYDFVGIDPETGKSLFRTYDGGITMAPNASTDKNYINLNPKWVGGLNNSFSYKGLQLDFFLSIVKKKSAGFFGNVFSGGVFGQNIPQFGLNRWQQPGDTAYFRKFGTEYGGNFRDNNFNNSTGNIIDGSFIKLRNVSLSWALPKKWITAAKFQNVNLYAQAQNLFSFSKYQGFDPEGGINTPPTRIITLGLRASL